MQTIPTYSLGVGYRIDLDSLVQETGHDLEVPGCFTDFNASCNS